MGEYDLISVNNTIIHHNRDQSLLIYIVLVQYII